MIVSYYFSPASSSGDAMVRVHMWCKTSQAFNSLTQRDHIWVVCSEKTHEETIFLSLMRLNGDVREMGKWLISIHQTFKFSSCLNDISQPGKQVECLCKSPWNWSLNTSLGDGFGFLSNFHFIQHADQIMERGWSDVCITSEHHKWKFNNASFEL